MECTDPDEFRVTVAESEECAALRLTGELDLASAETLRARLAPLLALDRTPPLMELLVDVGSLTFVDAAGLRALVDARRVLVRRSGRLVLRRPSPLVRRILRLLDLQEDFDLR